MHEDYNCTLNQTNIERNNKFYIIQLLKDADCFFCWTYWGRVGEVGQSKLSRFESLEDAKKSFEKKFRDKTKNSWAERDHFVAQPGKYTLTEVQREDEAQEVVEKVDGGPVKAVVQRVRPCSLDAATQKLITNIFSKDVFQNAMALMNLDVKKMPLGKLSKQQIARVSRPWRKWRRPRKPPQTVGAAWRSCPPTSTPSFPTTSAAAGPHPSTPLSFCRQRRTCCWSWRTSSWPRPCRPPPRRQRKWRKCCTHWTEITSSSSASSSCWAQRPLSTRWYMPT